MLEEKKQILNNNVLLNMRKNQKVASKNEKTRRLALILSVFLSLLIIGAIYFVTDYSNIYRVVVEGNYYLSDEDILKQSELSTDNKFLLTIPYVVENRIKQDPLIESCKVSLLDNRLVKIEVKEKKQIAYAFENNGVVLINDKNERVSLDKDSMYLINRLPYIEGFSNEDMILIEKNLVDCSPELINEISEIHYYPEMRYQSVELIMRDGNYIFTSPYGLKILNKYYDIESSYEKDGLNCYYFEDISGNAYTSACPWQEVPDEEKMEDTQEYEEVEESEDE